ELVFSRQMQGGAAGDQHVQAGTGSEHIGQGGRGSHHLLEVVQQQQQVALTQRRLQLLEQGTIKSFPQSERLGNGRDDSLGRALWYDWWVPAVATLLPCRLRLEASTTPCTRGIHRQQTCSFRWHDERITSCSRNLQHRCHLLQPLQRKTLRFAQVGRAELPT